MNPVKLKIIEQYGTQEKFAVVSGIHEGLVSKIVRGIRRPTKEQSEKFNQLLGIQIDQMLGEIRQNAGIR